MKFSVIQHQDSSMKTAEVSTFSGLGPNAHKRDTSPIFQTALFSRKTYVRVHYVLTFTAAWSPTNPGNVCTR